MKRIFIQPVFLVAMALVALTACRRDIELPVPGKPNPTTPVPDKAPVEYIDVKLQAVITIGSINYDSIPAEFRIISWDADNVPHSKDTLLAPGVNKVPVIKGHSRYSFRVNKWGITDAITLSKDELRQDVIYTLGGGKPAKLLKKEETFLYVMGAYQPKGKVNYNYTSKGLAFAEYYQKFPEHAELQYTQKQTYSHAFNNVTRIEVTNAENKQIGYTTFDYSASNKIVNMHEVKQSGETYSSVAYDYGNGGGAEITIDYLFDNGQAMEYKLEFKGGNRVSDKAVTSRGGGEGGTYKYDLNINPFAHMNMPNTYLTHLSKNNLIDEQKGYSGGFPVAEPYKFEYKYDEEGYPVELIKYYKNYLTKEEMYKTKTVYTY
ncbi:hypothetical protein [Paraflavitalea sp. CAU 1676]|uniref:hypothetical protein n=1 Tax=Paraflavitalea sp. CAU 1676 TaxID=3032598 RepID=UPI0023D9CC6F|nr:hypothetical protein [Paraflavitalea sp. CAU 1676]MDF2192741.1 hypothetical protein [Paraflavitalea sp. CAU 1676]